MKKIYALYTAFFIAGTLQAVWDDRLQDDREVTNCCKDKEVRAYYQAIDTGIQQSYAVTHVQAYKMYLGHAITLVNLYEKSLGDPQKVARFLWDTYATQDNAAKVIFKLKKPLKDAHEAQEYCTETKKTIDFYNNLFVYIAGTDKAPHDQLMAVAMAHGNIPLITEVAKRSPKHAHQMHQLFEAIHLHQITQPTTTTTSSTVTF